MYRKAAKCEDQMYMVYWYHTAYKKEHVNLRCVRVGLVWEHKVCCEKKASVAAAAAAAAGHADDVSWTLFNLIFSCMSQLGTQEAELQAISQKKKKKFKKPPAAA